MKRRLCAAVLLWPVLSTSTAVAQQTPFVTLVPENPTRWDAAGFVGWFGGHRSGAAVPWDEWSDSAVFGASAGFYWTPHVKVEIDAAMTTWGSVFVQERIETPGGPQGFRFGEHRFRSFHASGTLAYQFLQNTWFHPFVAAGIDGFHEDAELRLQEQPICSPSVCPPVRSTRESRESTRARPVVAAGFKWYLSERAFVRSDIRAVVSADRTEAVQWRAGAGVDF